MVSRDIKAAFIFEILGRPPEHIRKALNDFIDKLGEQKGIEIINKIIHEPKLLEKENVEDVYTSFAEVELSAENLNLIFAVVLNTLPANVEIIEPTELRLSNFDLSAVLSELAAKLHRFDEIAKALTLQRNQLINQINQMQENIKELDKPSFSKKDGDKLFEKNLDQKNEKKGKKKISKKTKSKKKSKTKAKKSKTKKK